MPYTTKERVRTLVSRAVSAPYSGTAGELPDESVDEAIDTAGQVIDSKLARLYSVPFSPTVPALIRDIATALAAWDIDLTFREVRDYQSELNPVLLRYKWAVELLAQLQTGDATLPDYEAPEDPTEPEDNLNDPGSIVVVYNPDLNAVGGCGCLGSCTCYQTVQCWGQYG